MTYTSVNTEQTATTEKLLNRWLLGSDALPQLDDFPSSWQPLLTQLPREKQAVTALGLLGHYQATSEQPHTTSPLVALPKLPSISAPLLDSTYPAYFFAKRLLDNSDFSLMVLNLTTQRGYALSPQEYFSYIAPKIAHNHFNPMSDTANLSTNIDEDGISADGNDETIDENNGKNSEHYVDYQPWQLFWETWRSRLTDSPCDESLDIDADNWADFMPAYRRQALSHLRQQDPQACLELIIHCFKQEPAEERVKILAVLYAKLSDDDVPFLQSLHNDRSQKVTDIANNLLMRAGCFTGFEQQDLEGSNEKADDAQSNTKKTFSEEQQLDLKLLADGLKVTKGKNGYKIQTVLYTEQKKRNSQRNKRRQLLTHYGLFILAETLGITLQQLLTGWAFDKHHEDDNHAFVACASHLPDEFMPYIVTALHTHTIENSRIIKIIWHRFNQSQRQQLLQSIISKNKSEVQFYELLDLHTSFCLDDEFDFVALKKMQTWKNMFAKKKEYYLEENCLALGFLLPQALAKQALEYLQDKLKEEHSVNDPMFYSLRLNVGLMNVVNNK